jgi:HEAT repeat protein
MWTDKYAAENLGDIRDWSAVPHLVLLLGDDDEAVLEAAKRALQRISSPEALFALHEFDKKR